MKSDCDLEEHTESTKKSNAAIYAELLIREIEPRPILWNFLSDDFKDRQAKEEAWDDVCSALNDDYFSYDIAKKKNFEKIIRSKWRNIKDAYRKSRVNGIHTNSASKKVYVYTDQLRFLDKTIDADPGSDIEHRLIAKPPTSKPETGKSLTSNRKKPVNVEKKINDSLETQLIVANPIDEHEAFFNSMLPTVRGFDRDEVLEFRAAVISLAQNIKWRKK